MKIGIMTFHWADNYGAVLQAYALQTHIASLGHDVEIIDYRPSWAADANPVACPRSLKDSLRYFDEKQRRRPFVRFRKRFLRLSKDTYRSLKELNERCGGYDVIITGSDQVFNPDIIASGGELDEAYLLNFGSGFDKVAYAASFGNSTLSEEYYDAYRNLLRDFKQIGVREESGVRILRNIGLNSVVVPDPTFLIEDYSALKLPLNPRHNEEYVFEMIFSVSELSTKVKTAVNRTFYSAKSMPMINLRQRLHGTKGLLNPSPQKWIAAILDAQFVVTDSFHCTVFSILNHTPFISLSLKGWGKDWSDRIKNLLQSVGLKGNLVSDVINDQVLTPAMQPIDWENVDCQIRNLRDQGRNFIAEISNRQPSY